MDRPISRSIRSIIRAVRRLAVGAGDVDDREGMLRVAQQLHHGGDAIQRGLEVVLRRARQDRLLDLSHPLANPELVLGIALGGLRASARHGLLPAPDRTICVI